MTKAKLEKMIKRCPKGKCYITAEGLREAGGCESEVRIFMRVFPSGRAHVTASNLTRARRGGVYIGWILHELKIYWPHYDDPFGKYRSTADHIFFQSHMEEITKLVKTAIMDRDQRRRYGGWS